MKPGSIVIVNLRSPVERLMGSLVEINPSGVLVRGLDIGAFEDWMDDVSNGNEHGLRPSTFFFPMHRVEKVILDEDLGGVPSLANAFLARTGAPVSDYLRTS